MHAPGKKTIPNPELPDDWKPAALALEKKEEFSQAIRIYEIVILKHPLVPYAYDRLLIIYRKQKSYQKEWALLTNALAKFDKLLHPAGGSKKIAGLSRKIAASVGLTDKKGSHLYQPQPIARWEKRLATVKKRMPT